MYTHNHWRQHHVHRASSVSDTTFITSSAFVFSAQMDSKLWVIDRRSYQTVLMQCGLDHLSHSLELLKRLAWGQQIWLDAKQSPKDASSSRNLPRFYYVWEILAWYISHEQTKKRKKMFLNFLLWMFSNMPSLCMCAAFPSCSHCQRMPSWNCRFSWMRYILSALMILFWIQPVYYICSLPTLSMLKQTNRHNTKKASFCFFHRFSFF